MTPTVRRTHSVHRFPLVLGHDEVLVRALDNAVAYGGRVAHIEHDGMSGLTVIVEHERVEDDSENDPETLHRLVVTTRERAERAERNANALGKKVERLTNAIAWACGEIGQFLPSAEHRAPFAQYWWRSELRQRAGLLVENGSQSAVEEVLGGGGGA
jgi:hypothetical protein